MFNSHTIHPPHVIAEAKTLAGLTKEDDLSRLEGRQFTFVMDTLPDSLVTGLLHEGGSEGGDGPKIFVKKMNAAEPAMAFDYFIFTGGTWHAHRRYSSELAPGLLTVF